MSEPIPDTQLKALLEAGEDVCLAFFFKRFGIDGLRTIAKALNWTRREAPEDAARAFEKRGLKEAADILWELAESLPSEIDDNPWLEEGRLGDNPRQAKIWDGKFLRRRQRQTGLHMREVVEHYRKWVPDLPDLSHEGTVHSDMRQKLETQIAKMRAERSNGHAPV